MQETCVIRFFLKHDVIFFSISRPLLQVYDVAAVTHYSAQQNKNLPEFFPFFGSPKIKIEYATVVIEAKKSNERQSKARKCREKGKTAIFWALHFA